MSCGRLDLKYLSVYYNKIEKYLEDKQIEANAKDRNNPVEATVPLSSSQPTTLTITIEIRPKRTVKQSGRYRLNN